MFIFKKNKFLLSNQTYSLVFFDQIIVSGSNFLISILLLRFLGVENFGIFSFLWLLLLFVNSVQISYIISPLLTNAPKQKTINLNFFYGNTFIQQSFFTILVFFLSFFFLEFFGHLLKDYKIQQFSITFSFTLLFSQFYQFFRRICFSKKLYLKTIISDFLVYLIIIFSLIYFYLINELNLIKIFWIFSISFFTGSILNFSLVFSFRYNLNKLFNFFRENWIISKWLVYTSILQWFSGNLWIVNTGIILGPYILGIVRACQTILNIANLIFQSLENIIPALTSKRFVSQGKNYMDNFLNKILKKGFLFTIGLSLIIVIFAKPMLNLFYGNETANYSELLMLMSFLLPLHFLQYPTSYGLRTLGKTKPIFFSYLITSVIAVLISIHVITYLKIYGFIFGLYFSQIIITSYLYISYKRYINN